MQSGARVNDEIVCRGRFLRREWKRYKPHLAKSTSLPQLELVPANRPLFTCERCGFSNVYIPLCLWCTWTSSDAASAFKAATPRRSRRISSPSKAVWKAETCGIREDHRSREPPTTLSGPTASFKSSLTTDAKSAIAVQPVAQYDPVVKATVGALRTSDADHQRKPSALRIRRGLPAASVVVPSRYPIMTTTIISSDSPHAPPRSGDIKHTAHPFSLPPLFSQPTPTLRRKHHMTFPGENSPRTRVLMYRHHNTPLFHPSHPCALVTRADHTTRLSDPIFTTVSPFALQHTNNHELRPESCHAGGHRKSAI
ncbi:hypothetical protein EI94DRAFT_1782242 [Lactarius quietus]|nr:hypothetical protein EI94DRAFT_1782242 [Lactarius quietus]